MKTIRVFIRTNKGRKPPTSKVQEFFGAERVHFISPIGDGVFTAVVTIKTEEELSNGN